MRFATGFILAMILGSASVACGDTQQTGGLRNMKNEVEATASRNLDSRIYYGNRVFDYREYPFFVALKLGIERNGNRYNWGSCGGVLFASDLVLTAAHCACGGDNTGLETCIDPTIKDQNSIPEQLGSRAYFNENAVNADFFNGNYKEVVDWRFDPDYHQDIYNNLWSDFAIGRLSDPVEIDESQASLVLNKEVLVPSEGDMLRIIGFGTTEDGSQSDWLREADIAYMPPDECRDEPSFMRLVDHRAVCAGYSIGEGNFPTNQNPTTGKGDSGGPLLLPRVVGGKTVYTHVGVTSYGSRPGNDGVGAVFADTSSAIPWIYEAVCGDGGVGTVSDFCEDFSPSCDGPELKIEVTTDTEPDEAGWKLSVQEGNDFVEVTSVLQYWRQGYTYNDRVCLEYGKQYKMEITDTFFQFSSPTVYCGAPGQCSSSRFEADTNGFYSSCVLGTVCIELPGCSQASVQTPCDCGNLGQGTCGSFGSHTLTLDGTILDNSVEASRNIVKEVRVAPNASGARFTTEFSSTTIFSTPDGPTDSTPTNAPVTPTDAPVSPTVAPVTPTDAPVSPTVAPVTPTDAPVSPTVAPVTPTGAPNDAPVTEAPANEVIPFVNRDENGNPICEDLPVNVRFNVIFGEDDRDTGEENDPEDKKRKNCASMEGFNIRQSETWCNRDARIRGIPQEYEEVLPNGSYVKVYNLCPESCRACADTCADSNQVFTVEGADPPVNRRCSYLDKRTDATAARLCRNKIALMKRGRVAQKPLTEQCARTCGLLGEGKCAAFLSNSIGV